MSQGVILRVIDEPVSKLGYEFQKTVDDIENKFQNKKGKNIRSYAGFRDIHFCYKPEKDNFAIAFFEAPNKIHLKKEIKGKSIRPYRYAIVHELKHSLDYIYTPHQYHYNIKYWNDISYFFNFTVPATNRARKKAKVQLFTSIFYVFNQHETKAFTETVYWNAIKILKKNPDMQMNELVYKVFQKVCFKRESYKIINKAIDDKDPQIVSFIINLFMISLNRNDLKYETSYFDKELFRRRETSRLRNILYSRISQYSKTTDFFIKKNLNDILRDENFVEELLSSFKKRYNSKYLKIISKFDKATYLAYCDFKKT